MSEEAGGEGGTSSFLPGQPITFRLELTATVAKDLEEDASPHLRFRFLDEKIQTDPLGGWSVVEEGGGGEGGGTEEGGEGGDESRTKRVVFSKEMTEIDCDEKKVREINADPIIHFFFGQKKEEEENHYLSWLFFDMSPLLDRETRVSQRYCFSSSSSHDGAGVVQDGPQGLEELTVTVTVDKEVLTPELRLKLNPLTITLEKVTNLPGVRVSEGGDPRLRRFLEPTPHALLQKHRSPVFACYRLFSLEGTGDNLADLEEKAQERDGDRKGEGEEEEGERGEGGQEEKEDGDASAAAGKARKTRVGFHSRLVRTVSLPHDSHLLWHQSSTFLLGILPLPLVREAMNLAPVRIEVHDRAPLPPNPEEDERRSRWNSYVKGTEPLPGEEKEGEGEEGEGEREAEPVDVFEVDEVVEEEVSPNVLYSFVYMCDSGCCS